MDRASLHLVVLVLAFSTLILPSSAVPSTRPAQLFQDTRVLPIRSTSQAVDGEVPMEEGISNGRMDIEINDYPGSGPNNHHTPKPSGRRILGLVVKLI